MLHTLSPKTKNKKAKRVGRGGKRGKTSGRGTKGQKARAGHKIRPQMRDIIKKLPKLRGRGKNSNKPFRAVAVPVNLDVLNKTFAAGDRITPGVLLQKGIINTVGGKLPKVKILGTGTIDKAVHIFDCLVSVGAAKAILANGGTIGGAHDKRA